LGINSPADQRDCFLLINSPLCLNFTGMKNFICIVTIAVLVVSCEKGISFDLNETAPKLVVEATIENNESPIVFLSRSVGFFSHISLDTLQNNFVHNAEIYISNGALTHKLKEYTVHIGAGYSLYYYSIDSSNLSTAFKGQLDRQYSLRIVSDAKEYTATTTIPKITKQIDSIYWKLAPPGNDTDEVAVMVKATDPPGLGDYIRFFTKRNREPFYPGLTSAYDDEIIDGTTYTVQLERGWDRNLPLDDYTPFFRKGDTVTLKLCNIDKATYDFWRTMEYSYANLGNPFATPTKVLSNISGNALGYFGGYAPQFRTIIIPR
jgi:hypothetical protein